MEFVEIELTQGNINNDHIYLSSVIEFFPSDSIGGSNDNSLAARALGVHSGISSSPVRTDIAGDKKVFRRRAWVGEFFEVHNLAAGGRVVIEKTGADRYHVYPKRAYSFNKSLQYAAGSRRTPFSLRPRFHYKGADKLSLKPRGN